MSGCTIFHQKFLFVFKGVMDVNFFFDETILSEEGKGIYKNYLDHFINVCFDKHKYLLFMIFGHIPFKDIKNIPLVCRYWYNLFKEPEFWNPFLKRKLTQKDTPEIAYDASVYLKHPKVTLKHAFGWMFESKGNPHWEANDFELSDITFASFSFEKDGKTPAIFVITDDDGIRNCLVLLKNTIIKSYRYRKFPINFFDGNFEMVCGTRFFGEISNNEFIEHMKPHGKGIWTFPNGSTFSGDKVACEGVPHGKGIFKRNENDEGTEVEFDFGHRVTKSYKRRKIKY